MTRRSIGMLVKALSEIRTYRILLSKENTFPEAEDFLQRSETNLETAIEILHGARHAR